jgi:hypothetical protein
MNGFAPLATTFKNLLADLIADPGKHAKWLNTLSYLENCGARKIARTEHPLLVTREVLKHAAEEFRHAFYLKQQISTRLGYCLPDYSRGNLLGGYQTLHYMDRLEARICRLIGSKDSRYPYILTTYAIELRAAELYPAYQTLLEEAKSPVSVRSILLDEKGHLEEMEEQIRVLGIPSATLKGVCRIEADLCRAWAENIYTQTTSKFGF